MLNWTGLFIALCWALFLFYWFATAFSVKRTVEVRGVWLRVLIGVLVFGGIVLLRSGDFDLLLWKPAVTAGLIADAFALAGLIVLLWARTVLGQNWSADIAFKQDHELIQRGPYAYVRHPIYSGVLLMGIGTALHHGTLGGFVLVLLVFAVFWLRALEEERLLTEHFPTQYSDYRARVKALIPYLI